MKNNVIPFPRPKEEVIEIKDRMTVEEDANEFASEIIEIIHNALHDKTGDCIFTDDEFMPIALCLEEVISAMYLLSQGYDDHPFQDIAKDIFGVDIEDEEGYIGDNVDNEEP